MFETESILVLPYYDFNSCISLRANLTGENKLKDMKSGNYKQREIVEIYKGFHHEYRDIKPWDQYRGDTRPSDTTVLNKISLREDLEYPLNNR